MLTFYRWMAARRAFLTGALVVGALIGAMIAYTQVAERPGGRTARIDATQADLIH
jgi:hypothetical protein